MPSIGGLTDSQKINSYLTHMIRHHPQFHGKPESVQIFSPQRNTDHFDVLITPENRNAQHNLVLLVEDTVNHILPTLLRVPNEPLETGKIFSKKPLELIVKIDNHQEIKVAGVEFGSSGEITITRDLGGEKQTLSNFDNVYARIKMSQSPAIVLQRIREQDPKGLDAALSEHAAMSHAN
jgi:hypothetical protein